MEGYGGRAMSRNSIWPNKRAGGKCGSPISFHVGRSWPALPRHGRYIKARSKIKPSPRVCLITTLAVLTLVCSGCQTFKTEEEFQAEMARQNANTFWFVPGW